MTTERATFPLGRSVQPISALVLPEWNPRKITEQDFLDLVASIERDPLFLLVRPPAVADGPEHHAGGIVYGGNQRVRAVMAAYEHGWVPPVTVECPGWVVGTIPIYTSDIPEPVAWERALVDNNNAGTFDEREVNKLLRKLEEEQRDDAIPLLGFVQEDLARLEQGLPLMSNEIRGAAARAAPRVPRAPNADDAGKTYTNQYAVAVMCTDEREQQVIFERLSEEGYNVKVLVV